MLSEPGDWGAGSTAESAGGSRHHMGWAGATKETQATLGMPPWSRKKGRKDKRDPSSSLPSFLSPPSHWSGSLGHVIGILLHSAEQEKGPGGKGLAHIPGK